MDVTGFATKIVFNLSSNFQLFLECNMRRKKLKTLKSSTALFLKSLGSMIVMDIVQFEEIALIQVSHYTKSALKKYNLL